MSRKRKGMIIKNTEERLVEINLRTRTLVIHPGEEYVLAPDEVKDPVLRENLQVRTISILRPATEAEEDEVQRLLEELEEKD